MKRLLLISLFFITVLSCKKELAPVVTPPEDVPEGAVMKEFRIGIATKTTLRSGKTEWVDGDKVRVFWGGGEQDSYPGTVVIKEDGSVVLESWVIESDAYYAVYPSDAEAVLNDGVMDVTIPAEQTGDFKDCSYLCAKADGDILNFCPVSSCFSFTLTRTDIKQALIRSCSDASLAGTVPVSFNGSGISIGERKETAIQYEVKATRVSERHGTFYLAVLPSSPDSGIVNPGEIALRCSPSASGGWYPIVIYEQDFNISPGVVNSLGNADELLSYDYFVKPGGTGSGRSWDDAASPESVAKMLMQPDEGNYTTKNLKLYNRRFRFASGEYPMEVITPDYNSSVSVAFYGGYSPSMTGTDLSVRQLDADGATVFYPASSSAPAFRLNGKNASVSFDYITFQNADVATGEGAAIVAWPSKSNSSTITLNRCNFISNNSAGRGAALALHYIGGVTANNCRFTSNRAQGNGGAVFIGTLSKTATFTNCQFSGNSVADGKLGGAMIMGGGTTILNRCTFSGNSASESSSSHGGAIAAYGKAVVQVNDCDFSANSAYSGASLGAAGTASIRVSGSTFTQNTAQVRGTVYSALKGGTPTAYFSDCIFRGNRITQTALTYGILINYNGAGMFVGLHNCSAYDNTAGGGQGALLSVGNADAYSLILNCSFIGSSNDANLSLVRFMQADRQVASNNVFINTSTVTNASAAGGRNSAAAGSSGGYNFCSASYFSSDASSAFAESLAYDSQGASSESFMWTDGEYWSWDGKGPSLFAGRSYMEGLVSRFDSTNGISAGSAFEDWLKSKSSWGKDQTGKNREDSAWWPGAWQGSSAADAAEELKIMSFNILNNNTAVTSGERSWAVRSKGVYAMLEAERPLVIGSQELPPASRSDIMNNCPEYDFVGEVLTGTPGGSSNSILWLKEGITATRSGTFWLSHTPDKLSVLDVSTIGLVQSDYPALSYRGATWAEFVTKRGTRFFFVSVHFSHLGSSYEPIRVREAEIVLAQIKRFNTEGLPVIITGDFNVTSSADSYKVITNAGYSSLRETAPVTDNTYTFNDFGYKGSVIDHIFYKGEGFTPVKFKTVNQAWAGVDFISDHFPVYGKLLL